MCNKIVKIEGIIEKLSIQNVDSVIDELADIVEALGGRLSIVYKEMSLEDWMMEDLDED